MQVRKESAQGLHCAVAKSEEPARWQVVAAVEHGLKVAFVVHLLDCMNERQSECW
jgi:hypothetical protein